MKHRVEMTKQIMIPLTVAYEVEFDDETGEADIVSAGRVTQFRESMSRREVAENIQLADLDGDAYQRLVETKILPRPKDGEVVMLGRRPHRLSYDEDVFDPNDATASELVDALSPIADAERNIIYKQRRKAARRRT